MAGMKSIEVHLEGFVKSFVSREFRNRWLHILLEKPKKAAKELRKFERHLDQRSCRLIENASDVMEQILGTTEGFYLDGLEPPKFTSLREAIDESNEKAVDAIFSISPGKQAVFLFHEGWAWICEK
jgi:hypothetical protein